MQYQWYACEIIPNNLELHRSIRLIKKATEIKFEIGRPTAHFL